MGSVLLERGGQHPEDVTKRIATLLERQETLLPDLRQAATTLREVPLRVIGIAGFSFNEVDSVEGAIMRAATGSVVLSRRLPLGYRRVLNSYAFVQMGDPNPEEIDYVHAAIKDMTELTPDSRFLSFVDVRSPSEIVLGAVNLQTEEVFRYKVDQPDA